MGRERYGVFADLVLLGKVAAPADAFRPDERLEQFGVKFLEYVILLGGEVREWREVVSWGLF